MINFCIICPAESTDQNTKYQWNGPTNNIWNNDECTHHGYGISNDLEQCKTSCLEKPGCNAINYSPGSSCVLRKCEQPVPSPLWNYAGYNGYFLKEGIIDEQAYQVHT